MVEVYSEDQVMFINDVQNDTKILTRLAQQDVWQWVLRNRVHETLQGERVSISEVR
jgi:hypothetical protein